MRTPSGLKLISMLPVTHLVLRRGAGSCSETAESIFLFWRMNALRPTVLLHLATQRSRYGLAPHSGPWCIINSFENAKQHRIHCRRCMAGALLPGTGRRRLAGVAAAVNTSSRCRHPSSMSMRRGGRQPPCTCVCRTMTWAMAKRAFVPHASERRK